MWGRLKVYREKIAVDNVWNLVKMTNSEIEFSKFFEKNIDRLLNFNIDDEEELKELYEELSPIIETLQDYSRIGMTFSINPKADDLINRVLIKKGQKSLVDKMEKISKKKYFVE
jgi:DNA-directed RNA polymerase subunit F